MLAWLSLSENTTSPLPIRADTTPKFAWYPVLKIKAFSFPNIFATVFSSSVYSGDEPVNSLADADDKRGKALLLV